METNQIASPLVKAHTSIYAIGLMSGTSFDGVDAALIKTDGTVIEEFGASNATVYPDDFRQKLRQAIYQGESDRSLEEELTHFHAQAVEALIEQCSVAREDISLIGFHGQTILHNPAEGITKQIGDPQLLASLTNIDVVGDFRSNDVRQGGEGAPFAPAYHRAVLHEQPMPISVVNIGGVANVTYIDGEELLAFDTGPGNAWMDEWVVKHCQQPYDDDGKIAGGQTINHDDVVEFLQDEYFDRQPPKSLDRNHFAAQLESLQNAKDSLATLTECTVQSIIGSQKYFPKPVKRWLITGGGRKNGYMIRRLQEQLSTSVEPIEAVGLDGDMVEAQAFAYLAVRSLYQLPLTFPKTTGVKEATLGGVFYPVSRA